MFLITIRRCLNSDAVDTDTLPAFRPEEVYAKVNNLGEEIYNMIMGDISLTETDIVMAYPLSGAPIREFNSSHGEWLEV